MQQEETDNNSYVYSLFNCQLLLPLCCLRRLLRKPVRSIYAGDTVLLQLLQLLLLLLLLLLLRSR